MAEIEAYTEHMAALPRLAIAQAERILRECGYEFIPSDRYYGPHGFAKALGDLVAAAQDAEEQASGY